MPGSVPVGPVAARPIGHRERSGVLHPRNLERYAARWISCAEDVCAVVDQYWHVRWCLDGDESILQRIIDLPVVTLTVEEGDVPAPLIITGVHGRAWKRRIAGSGSAFGIRLRPAGLAVLGRVSPDDVADATIPVTPELDARLHSLLSDIAAYDTPEARARAANALIRERLAECHPTPDTLLANAVLEELRARIRSRTGSSLSEQFGVSERTIQRALRATLGRGPKWVSRRIRLQEVARHLSTEPCPDLSALALELGYSDQSHLSNDFRSVAGITPGGYVHTLRLLAEGEAGTTERPARSISHSVLRDGVSRT